MSSEKDNLAEKKPKKSSSKDTKQSAAETTTSKAASSTNDLAVISLLKTIREDQSSLISRVTNMESKFQEYDSYFTENEHYYDEDYEPSMKRPRSSHDEDCYEDTDTPTASTSRFQRLANKYKTEEIVSDDVDELLAKTVNDMFTKSLPETVSDSLTDDEKCPRPKNCDGLRPVKLNKLIWDVVSPKARNNDKKLQNVEKYIVKAGIHLTKTMVTVSKMEKECSGDNDFSSVLNSCEDAIALLGQANVDINMTRRDFLRPELKSEYAHLCNHSYPFTVELFGDDVSKAAKEIEDCNKMGNRLQYPQNQRARGRPSYRGRFFGARRPPYGRAYYGQQPYNRPPKNEARRGGARK